MHFSAAKKCEEIKKTVKKIATSMNQTQHPENRYSGDQ
jgi:hypothetical protein